MFSFHKRVQEEKLHYDNNCSNFNLKKQDSVSSVPCLHRFKSKSLQTKADISVNLRSTSPPSAVKTQPTECGEKSF